MGYIITIIGGVVLVIIRIAMRKWLWSFRCGVCFRYFGVVLRGVFLDLYCILQGHLSLLGLERFSDSILATDFSDNFVSVIFVSGMVSFMKDFFSAFSVNTS